MRYPEMDADMQELFAELGKAILPRQKRRAVVRTNRHVPYYMDARYRRV